MTNFNKDTQHATKCPLCGSERYSHWKLGLLICKSCSLVISPAIWQPQANEKLEEEWFGENYQPVSSVWVKVFEKWNNRRTLARLAKVKSSGHRILEIGVGSGSFLIAARARGYEVMGCDLSKAICNRVSSAFGIEMHCGPLTTIEVDKCFDVVVMNHVLEHVQQPVDFLTNVSQLLAPDGIVHIAVPNISCWQSILSGWNSFEPYHLTYFEPKTLKSTVILSGLVIDQTKTVDSFSGWFLAVLRTLLGVNRKTGTIIRTSMSTADKFAGRRPLMVENVYRILTVAVGLALWPFRLFQALIGRGDEIICIARKPQSAATIAGNPENG